MSNCFGTRVLLSVLLLALAQGALAQPPTPPPAEPENEPLVPQPNVPTVPQDDPLTIPNTNNFDSGNSPFLSSLLSGNQPRRRFSDRLARTPAVFGDFYNNIESEIDGNEFITVAFPSAGGNRVKIAEQNSALPTDRIFFYYNHFQNAIRQSVATGPGAPAHGFKDASLDRYTFGLEKTYHDGNCSIEFRLPITGGFSSSTPEFSMSGGTTGNLAVVLKQLVYDSDTHVAAIGIGVGVPTGSDVTATLTTGGTSYFRLHNEAVHLSPYFGFLSTPNDQYFFQGFLQFDVATNGNPVEVINGGSGAMGKLHDTPLMFVDLSVGHWLLQQPENPYLTALAAIAEVHYNSTIGDTATSALTSGFTNIGGQFQRYDNVNVTAGLHAELVNRLRLRVSGAFPLNDARRFFDGEVNASVILHY